MKNEEANNPYYAINLFNEKEELKPKKEKGKPKKRDGVFNLMKKIPIGKTIIVGFSGG